jgi:CheY-like chemotaxis protein
MPRGHISRQQPTFALWRDTRYHTDVKVESAMVSTFHSSQTDRTGRPTFTSALLLARHEDHAVVDRRSLRQAGIRCIRVLTSGAEAARLLSGRQAFADDLPFPDLALCDEQLSDMSGQEFLSLIRSHPKLAVFPVLVALLDDTPAVRSGFEDLAASGILCRPYSADMFLGQLLRAQSMHQPNPDGAFWTQTDGDTQAFDLALSRFDLSRKVSDQSAGQWVREGLTHLKYDQWEPASMAFQQALKAQGDHAEALEGLTRALRKRQEAGLESDPDKPRLSREQADALRENLLRAARSDNPELAMQAAVIAALYADEPTQDEASPASVSPAAPSAALSAAATPSPPAFAGNAGSGASAARGFGAPAVLMKLPEPPMPADSGLFSSFPLLRDAVTVAKVTLGLYKHRKKN